MKVSYRWLKQLAPTIEDSARDLAERLTYTAVPVDDVVWLGAGLEELVVARVESVSPHPQADRLVICQVDAGRDELVQVVTGAPVVIGGGYYPFVGVGQTLPGGLVIKRAKLRGEYSEGMLCSEKELGVGRDAAGIMQLNGEFTPGQPVLDAMELDDYQLDIDVTANRPDLLGHWGVARELAPAGEADLRLPGFPNQPSVRFDIESAAREGTTAGVTVRIEDPEGCPRYMGAVVRGVSVGPSPEWLANRLRAIGQQPINNVVDATNFVLNELNQPLHAFDLEALRGPAVVIRRARPGEKLRTLDGQDRELDTEMLVIADADVATAMAGVMGGESSEVTDSTRDVFIECAYFDPKRVRRAARGLGLDTDASYRFQRGIDPCGLPRALERVIELIVTTAGGEVDGRAVDVNPIEFAPRTLPLRRQRVGHLLGVELGNEAIAGCLEPIGFEVSEGKEGRLAVVVPTWRPDVDREVDLIEEVARRHGYDKFPDAMRSFRPTTVSEDPFIELFQRLRQTMIGMGFLEAKSSPFAPPAEGEVRLLNPLSEREDHLRRDLLTGLVHRLEYNYARGKRDVRLFEIGTVFAAGAGELPAEEIRLAAVMTGCRSPLHWSGDAGDWDAWDLKAIFGELGALAWPDAEVQPLHAEPGAARDGLLTLLTPDGQSVGRAAAVPVEGFEVPRWAGAIWGFEIALQAGRRAPTLFKPLPVYPAVERDLALIVPLGMISAETGAVIREAGPAYLEDLSVFDVYEGENIPEGTRSIAWRLRFRSPDRTLTDEEVDAAIRRITSALEEKLNVGIRGA
ncbi:MAG: phenylalanine--tRNA ligase subunit beta [Gemmatimonadales bacterium]|jgi:phenylalanyl-tRNA synthetase beta chain